MDVPNSKRKKRKRRGQNGAIREEVIDSILDSFEDQPSNLTMIRNYERLAKTHLNKYLKKLKLKENEPSVPEPIIDNDMIGSRSSYSIYPTQRKQVMFESLALQFVGRLQESFHTFKDYCAKIDNAEEDCAILDTDWNNVLDGIK